ncbi:MAG: hypothetical protein KIT69_09440 [Propionibacteriaceae bacterium]|nr:hypothetical protein [Propionibacteriaceae bacterium]
MMLLVGCAPAAVPPAAPTVAEQPSVTLEPTETAVGTLYAPADAAPDEQQAWLERIERTSGIVAGTDLGSLDDGWDGRIVVELPPSQPDYLALAGPDSGEAAATTRCDAEGSRITINPLIRSESSSYLDSLLLHEAVHAATGSACTDAPLWIEEGVAEWLTEQHDPATQHANRQWLDHELAAGLPAGLPPDSAFRGASAQISGAYALAAFAVAVAIEQLGQDQAMAYFAVPDERTTGRLTQWYLAGLRTRTLPTASAQR